jgi:hypothetical protein
MAQPKTRFLSSLFMVLARPPTQTGHAPRPPRQLPSPSRQVHHKNQQVKIRYYLALATITHLKKMAQPSTRFLSFSFMVLARDLGEKTPS